MKKLRKIIALWLCALLLVVNVQAAPFDIDPSDGEALAEFFIQLLKVTENNYRYDVTYEQLLEAAVQELIRQNPELFADLAKGAYTVLDENSHYLLQQEYEAAIESAGGQYIGIGINLTQSNGKVILGASVPDTPAAASGLQPGDIVVAVDGEDVTGYAMNKVVGLIRGPEGTMVTVEVERDGARYSFEVQRKLININPVAYQKLEGNNAGYIRLTAFSSASADYFQSAVEELTAQGVDKMILDLRGNGGGYVDRAVRIVSHFIPNGELVVTESYKDEKKDKLFYAEETAQKLKVVVLVDENSASASELVAGAIQDYQIGPLVGKTTYGKGTVQTPVTLKNQDAIWLTIAQYNLPTGRNIHGEGLRPDYMISNKEIPIDISGMQEMAADKKYQYGDSGPGVLAIKQRLNALGYQFHQMNDRFDDRMVDVVAQFQQNQGLYAYGVADFTTQIKLVECVYNARALEDTQLEKAMQLIMEMR